MDENGIQRWFADGEMNTCYMALVHHVAQGRGEQIALIYDSPVTTTKMQFTYRELLEKGLGLQVCCKSTESIRGTQ